MLGRGGVADTFDRLKEQGLIHASGITAAGDTVACLEVIESGRFDTAQVYYNAINPSAAWSRAAAGPGRRRISPASSRPAGAQNMGMLNIRVWAGGPLASAKRPDRLAVFTSGTDLDNECAAPTPCAGARQTTTARPRRRRCASRSATAICRPA